MATTVDWFPGIAKRKDPDNITSIQWDVSTWIDTSSMASYSIVSSNCSVDSDSRTGDVVKALVSGGTIDVFGQVTLRAVRGDGAQEDFTVLLEVKNDHER